MKGLLTIFFISFCFYANSTTYPISPRPLRKLVMESKHIIVGRVVKIEETQLKKKKEVYDTRTTAVILVKENLQGFVKEDTIRVDFRPNMICPAPAMYFPNTDVLAFLDIENGKYSTHALSYGSKTLEISDLNIYRQRISEIQVILKNTNEVAKLKETIDWFVKCAENDVTRWEGTFELSPESDFMSFYSREKSTDYQILLSPDQKQRLKVALIKSASISYVDLGLVDLVYLGNEDEVDGLMLNQLKVILDDTDYWTVLDYMKRLAHLNKSESVNSCITEMSKYLDDYLMTNEKEAEMKATKKKFIALVENPDKNQSLKITPEE